MPKVLVPVDGSASSERAVRYLLEKLGWYREPAEVHLLSVQHPLHGDVKMFVDAEQIRAFHHEEGLKALAPARAILDGAGVSYHFHIGIGDPAHVIAQYAKEKGCDQILIGTRGLGSVAGMIMGSVATKVVHLADVPVVLVK